MKWTAAFIVCAAVFTAMDLSWLSVANARFYTPVIGSLLSGKIQAAPAAAFYLVYLFGLMFLAVAPGVKTGALGRTAINAAVYGVCAYGTYDLTNQATMKVWSTQLTLMDMAWGLVVSTVAACAGYLAARALGKRSA
jgi:uncharacterized membrane protein